jgi:hypothetical protein
MVLGSGIRDPEKTYPRSRVKKATVPGTGSATLGRIPVQLLCLCRKMRADLEDSEEKVRGLRSSLETAYR